MRVFVTGATGFIGSAIVQDLLDAGHQVLGLARSDAAAARLAAVGAEVHRGSLDDPESLGRGGERADGVIHAGFVHDFADYTRSGETDRRAVDALGETLAGSFRPLVVTSVTALLAPGRVRIEHDATDVNSTAAVRLASEQSALSVAARDVRSSVVRLPPSVHGNGDRGFIPTVIDTARATGVSAYPGTGENRWPAVHRLDAARLYRLALENASAGAVLHAVADEGVSTMELAERIGRRLGLPPTSLSPEQTAEHFGWLAGFWALDNPTSSALTQQRTGWRPTHPGLLADLDDEHYFAIAASKYVPQEEGRVR